MANLREELIEGIKAEFSLAELDLEKSPLEHGMEQMKIMELMDYIVKFAKANGISIGMELLGCKTIGDAVDLVSV